MQEPNSVRALRLLPRELRRTLPECAAAVEAAIPTGSKSAIKGALDFTVRRLGEFYQYPEKMAIWQPLCDAFGVFNYVMLSK